MGLLDFVKSADPFKVKVGERALAENEIPLITETADRVISPSLQTISLVDQTIQDELNVNSGKRKKRVAFVFGSSLAKKAQTEGIGEQAATSFGSAAAKTEDATSSSVTPTLEHSLEDAPRDNVRMRLPSGRFVVLPSGSADTDKPATSHVVLLVSSSQDGASMPVVESAGDGHPLSAPELETGTLSNLLDHVTLPRYWAMLYNQHDAGFLESFNINSAQHRDAKVAELKAKLEKSESEAVEVEELRKRASNLEAMVAVKGQVVGKSKMQEEFVSHQDAAELHFMEHVVELDARIADV
ncbi:hypothetical protein Tco_1297863 [Tanacetum coccineum]